MIRSVISSSSKTRHISNNILEFEDEIIAYPNPMRKLDFDQEIETENDIEKLNPVELSAIDSQEEKAKIVEPVSVILKIK